MVWKLQRSDAHWNAAAVLITRAKMKQRGAAAGSASNRKGVPAFLHDEAGTFRLGDRRYIMQASIFNPYLRMRSVTMPTTKLDMPTESNLSDRVSDAVEHTKSKLTEFGTTAASKIDENRVAAADGLEGAADSLHQRADQLPGGEKVTNLAHSAADKLTATADYVRQNDLSSMVNDVEELVKKNPGPALAIAAGLGFLVARAFSNDSRG